jgi:hypothetical protein
VWRRARNSGLRADLGTAWRTALGRALLFLIIALLNPFEILQWSEERSHDLWQKIAAHRYAADAAKTPEGERGRDRGVVVYLDDETLRDLGQSRPIGGFDLLDMIEDIALAGGETGAPRALFVDFLLTHSAPKGQSGDGLVAAIPAMAPRCAERRREDLALSPFQCLLVGIATLTRYDSWRQNPFCRASTLARIACIRRAGGLPILFADPRAAGQPGSGAAAPVEPSSPALDALGTVAATVPVAVDRRFYPLVTPSDAAERENRSFQLYPAAALYAVLCSDLPRVCGPPPVVVDSQGQLAWSRRYDEDIDVLWGVGTESGFTHRLDRLQGGALKQRCAPARTDRFAPLTLFARLLTSGINVPGKKPCPYTDSFSYGVLQSQASQEDVAAMLGGRLVLFGGQFQDSNDVIRAPPFGDVAGVYYHAMALDNLVQKRDDYLKPAQPIAPFLDMTWTDAANLVAVFGVAFVLAFARMRLKAGEVPISRAEQLSLAEFGKRIGLTAIFGLVLLALLFIMARPTGLIPERFNLVAITLVCLWGMGQLAWTAIQPLRAQLLRRSPFIRYWSEVFDPSDRRPRHPRGGSRGRDRANIDAAPGDDGAGGGSA